MYESPANPFVFGFLGHVNLFHGRAHDGLIHVGEAALEAPEHADATHAPAVGFARPHELEVERYMVGQAGIVARLERALVVGPYARLELRQEGTENLIEADIPADRFRTLALKNGERLVVRPRKMRVFLRDAEATASDYII